MSPRSGLGREEVVRTAAELVNQEGSSALTINRLAERLGVKPPSLYNHIAGLPDLYRQLSLLNARQLGDALANAAIGKSGPQAVRAIAQAYRAYILHNPGLYLAGLRSSGNQTTPDPELQAAEERSVQVVLAVVASFGLTGEDALHAVRALRSAVHGFTTLELAGGFGLPLSCDESFRRLVEVVIEGLRDRG